MSGQYFRARRPLPCFIPRLEDGGERNWNINRSLLHLSNRLSSIEGSAKLALVCFYSFLREHHVVISKKVKKNNRTVQCTYCMPVLILQCYAGTFVPKRRTQRAVYVRHQPQSKIVRDATSCKEHVSPSSLSPSLLRLEPSPFPPP